MDKLKEFKEYLNKINQYEQASNILQWDMQTCMPYNGGDSNTDVLTMLSSKSFELSVSDKMCIRDRIYFCHQEYILYLYPKVFHNFSYHLDNKTFYLYHLH